MLHDSRPQKNPQVVYRELAEGGVLLNLESGQYHGLNGTGLVIWDLIDGRRTISALLTELRTRLDAVPADLEREVAGFLESLQARDLLAG